MLSVGEIRRSLGGAWWLFLNRADGLKALDRSVEGFWRSFAVILLLLPLTAISVLAVTRNNPEIPFGELFMAQLPLMAVDWVAFPLLLALGAKPLGISAHYVDYVVARNWAAPIGSAFLTVPLVLEGVGWVPSEGANILSIVALLVVMRYHFVIVRITLKTPVAFSIGLVIADFFLSLVMIGLFD